MNQWLSAKIRLFKWTAFRHDFHNVTVFIFLSFDLTSLFLIRIRCKMKIRTPYNTNIIMDKSFFLKTQYQDK